MIARLSSELQESFGFQRSILVKLRHSRMMNKHAEAGDRSQMSIPSNDIKNKNRFSAQAPKRLETVQSNLLLRQGYVTRKSELSDYY